jgi:hypothetical protein
MADKTWAARIKLTNGTVKEVTVQADGPYQAKELLERLYGKGSVWGAIWQKN